MVLSFRLTILASISVRLSIIQKTQFISNILSNKNDVLIRFKYGHLTKGFSFNAINFIMINKYQIFKP
ncbi:hypothetical protein BCL90_1078 [Pedobacter alluvionis]|uniref:Uncharacterized protein n=1 Tax=Pedobacter alluvionis TaxID=475253 RepID=A0A497Y9V4_9SPHI|nr:hypothetical protein BCL90_1078 [Pedobacter alluvionis]